MNAQREFQDALKIATTPLAVTHVRVNQGIVLE